MAVLTDHDLLTTDWHAQVLRHLIQDRDPVANRAEFFAQATTFAALVQLNFIERSRELLLLLQSPSLTASVMNWRAILDHMESYARKPNL